MAQWIRRRSTEPKILGSIPSRVKRFWQASNRPPRGLLSSGRPPARGHTAGPGHQRPWARPASAAPPHSARSLCTAYGLGAWASASDTRCKQAGQQPATRAGAVGRCCRPLARQVACPCRPRCCCVSEPRLGHTGQPACPSGAVPQTLGLALGAPSLPRPPPTHRRRTAAAAHEPPAPPDPPARGPACRPRRRRTTAARAPAPPLRSPSPSAPAAAAANPPALHPSRGGNKGGRRAIT
jgi:hypothetical protein